MKTIERQVIVTWHTPDEKLPEEGVFTIITFSGKRGSVTYDHAFGIADWDNDGEGWIIEGIDGNEGITVHAWCDLEPYDWKNAMAAYGRTQ